ncbi:MAG TPA: hypothetical protein VIY56_16720, partial [Vicinamibacterales bacterium]
MDLRIGDCTYRLGVTAEAGRWVSSALRTDTGERFGIECAGATEDEAVDRLVRWLRWQSDHTEAMRVLQDRERDYHRAVTGTAFETAASDPLGAEQRRIALDQVDSARRHLDEVRASRPGE